jgi:hypothetical protein
MFAALIERLRQISRTQFFDRIQPLASAWQIIGWWESRRVPYNLIVGATGVLTCSVFFLIAVLADYFFHSDFGLPDPPLFGIFAVIAYGVMANVCYTGGWLAEIIVLKIWPEDGKGFGKISFALGLLFSIGLTLLPAVFIVAFSGLKLLNRISTH